MDNNDSIKSQQTGGLKLMTVFIAVLALHVVVIGGFTVYHLMSGGSDPDVATLDKHKDGKSTDTSIMADGSTSTTSADKSTTPATTPDQVTTTDAGTPASTSASTTTTAPTPATTPAPATTPSATPATTSAPALAPSPVPATTVASTSTPAPAVTPAPVLAVSPQLTLNVPKPSPIAPALVPPPDGVTPSAQTPSGPVATLTPMTGSTPPAPLTAAGPVHMPPAEKSPDAPKIAHEHHQTYTVKITDSYSKIAKAHHVTVAQLKEANHIKGNTLHTGQKLVIPSNGSIVATTASATDLAPTPTRAVLKQSDSPETASLSAEPATASTGLHHHTYTIQKGDTLVKIAHKFKTTPVAIMEANDIPDPAKLTIGKKLHIPSHETRAARATPVAPVAQPVTMQPATVQPAPVQPSQLPATDSQSGGSGALANFVPN